MSEVEEGLRIDAEMYQRHFIEAEELIRKQDFVLLNSEALSIKKGIFDIKADCYLDEGVPFVRISNLKNMITDENDVVYIPESEHLSNQETALKRNDIVLSKTAYPAASLVTFEECNTSQDIIAVKLKGGSRIESHYLVAFLNTKYGLNQMQRWFTGNIQMHLNLTDCKNLFVPVCSKAIQHTVKKLFQRSTELKEQSEVLYAEAESLLLDELGLTDWRPTNENVAVKSFAASYGSTDRLDAEYYQPKYQRAMSILSRSGKRIGDVAVLAKEKFNPSGLTSFNYIEIGNLSGDGSTEAEKVSIEDTPSRAQWIVKTNDIITSTVRPIRKLSALIEPEQVGFICSSGFAVLRPKAIQPELLLVFLRAPIVSEILDLHTTASMYPAISTEDLLQIPITLPSDPISHEIVQKIRDSRSVKKESKRLLNIAKRSVEIAIEQDEATALKWMDQQSTTGLLR